MVGKNKDRSCLPRPCPIKRFLVLPGMPKQKGFPHHNPKAMRKALLLWHLLSSLRCRDKRSLAERHALSLFSPTTIRNPKIWKNRGKSRTEPKMKKRWVMCPVGADPISSSCNQSTRQGRDKMREYSLTDCQGKRYKGYMAKHLVKANRTGNQVRISLPKLLLQEMRWERASYYVLEKLHTHTITVKKLDFKEDPECKQENRVNKH